MQLFDCSTLEHIFQNMVYINVQMARKHSIKVQTKFNRYVTPINYKHKIPHTTKILLLLFEIYLINNYHSTGYATTNTGTPCLIDFVTCGTGCQESNEQYHKSQGSHTGGYDNKYHLNSFNPRYDTIQIQFTYPLIRDRFNL